MDEADLAQASQERFERQALERQLASLPTGESAEECEECGEPIPEGSRRAVPGCTRCVRCQAAIERARGRR